MRGVFFREQDVRQSVLLLTLKGLALDKVEVVGLLEDAVLEAPAEPLQVTVVDVEKVTFHPDRRELEVKCPQLEMSHEIL